jgi:tetratricopeptide (TPR) repeat protein
VLRDELEGIDFYIAQGYVEIARDTLDRLRLENGEHPEILARYDRLGESFGSVASVSQEEELIVEADEFADGGFMADFPASEAEEQPREMAGTGFEINVSDDSDGDKSASNSSGSNGAEDKPFFVQKESGPLYPDLVVQLNTSELKGFDAFSGIRPPAGPASMVPAVQADAVPTVQAVPPPPPVEERIATGDLIASLVSGIDSSFDSIHRPEPESVLETDSSLVDVPSLESSPLDNAAVQPESDRVANLIASTQKKSESQELLDIFEELKEKTGDLKPLMDFETHYSLGLAYKDMDLLDDAISEFQMAFRTAGITDLEGDCINCCNMLGVCFKRKQMPKVAVMWFERGLKIENRTEDEYQALRFEIGVCQEEMGDFDAAIETFTEVYGIDVSYRKVGDKLKQLRKAKTVA